MKIYNQLKIETKIEKFKQKRNKFKNKSKTI